MFQPLTTPFFLAKATVGASNAFEKSNLAGLRHFTVSLVLQRLTSLNHFTKIYEQTEFSAQSSLVQLIAKRYNPCISASYALEQCMIQRKTLTKEGENGRQPRPNGRCAQNLSKILYKIEQSSLERFLNYIL